MLHRGGQRTRPASTQKERIAREADVDEGVLAEGARDRFHVADKHAGTDTHETEVRREVVREHTQPSREQAKKPDSRQNECGEDDRTQRGLSCACDRSVDRVCGSWGRKR